VGGKLDGFTPIAVAEEDDGAVALLRESEGDVRSEPLFRTRGEAPNDFVRAARSAAALPGCDPSG
jgi:hypothetical protein